MKNTIVERNGGCPLVLTNAHLCSAQACTLPRAQREERFQRWPCAAHRCIRRRAGGGFRMIHQWEWSGCASDKRNDKGISDRWISPAAVKGAWKRCSHSSIHPRQQATPAVPPPPTWCLTRSPAHTHNHIFTSERFTHMVRGRSLSHMCMHFAWVLHRHRATHKHFVYRHHQGSREVSPSCWHFHRH